MPSNWLSIDTNFPTFTGVESTQAQIRALHNYLFQLREGLQYSLQNLTAENFNGAAWQSLQEDQKNAVTEEIQKIYSLIQNLSSELSGLNGKVNGMVDVSKQVEDHTTAIGDLKEWTGTVEQTMEEMGQGMEGLTDRIGSEEERITKLEGSSQNHSEAIDGLTDRVDTLEVAKTDHENRISALETEVTGEQGLMALVLGTGGLMEQVDLLKEMVTKLAQTVQVAEDGSAVIGEADKALALVGQVTVNGVPMEQAGTGG